MSINSQNKVVIFIFISILVLSSFTSVIGTRNNILEGYDFIKNPAPILNIKQITLEFSFSDPTISTDGDQIWVYLDESDLNMMIPDKPVLPVNITVLEFVFGTEIIDVEYSHSDPIEINLSRQIARAGRPNFDQKTTFLMDNNNYKKTLENGDPFPSDWVYYHLAGGLSHEEHTTFYVNRIYPVVDNIINLKYENVA